MLNIECGQTLDPLKHDIDTFSAGTDWRKGRTKDSDITLFTTCPIESVYTYIDLTPVDAGLDISQMEDAEEARERILRAPIFKCNGAKQRWCPLYEDS